MANERFKVKFGLAVGDTAATIDATTGDIVTTGDIQLGGNDIRASDGNANITLTSNTLTAFAGDIRVGGNDVQTSDGTTALTLTNVTGSVAVAGDLGINGGDITTSQTTGTVFNATATTVKLGEAATTVSIGANTGTTTINNSLVADDISIATIDATNLEVTNIKAKDGTAAMTIADTTGAVTVSSSLQVDNIDIRDNTISSTNTNGAINLTPNGTGTVVILTADITNLDVTNIRALDGTAAASIANTTGIITVSTELNVDNLNISGNTISSTNTNGDILITPNGTGDVDLVTDTVQIGDVNATATLTTNGTGDLVLNTNSGTNAGNITLTNGVNGNITVAPNGTGNIALNTLDGGNVVASRNFVDGAIRNANTQARGNIWELLATTPPTAPTAPVSGLSIDNSLDQTKTAGMVIRNYGAAAPSRGRFIFERSRGTAAAPSQVVVGDFLGEVGTTGYTGAGWINDLSANMPGFFGFSATETWTGTSNVGTGLTISLQPTATALAAGSQVPVLQTNPQASLSRSDSFNWGSGKTTGFVATGCSTSGTTLTIGTVTSGTVAIGQFVQTATIGLPTGVFIVSGSGTTWTLSTSVATLAGQTVTGITGYFTSDANRTFILNDLRLFRNTVNNSSGTPQVTLTGNRSNLTLTGDAITAETVSGTDLLVMNPANTIISSDIISLKDASQAALKGGQIDYRRTFGCFHKVANVTAAAANTVYNFDWYTDTTVHVGNQGVTVTSGQPTRVNIDAAGSYTAFVEIQVKNTVAGNRIAWIWLAKNGTDLAETRIKVEIKQGGATDAYQLINKLWLLDSIAANDYVEVRFAVDDNTGISLEYEAAQTTPFVMPAQPSATFTIVPVGA